MINISWYKIQKDFNFLINSINDSCEKFDYIYAIPRGGLVLGVMASHHLEIPLILSFSDLFFNKKFLVIDEISDKGDTLSNLICYYSKFNIKTCSLYVRRTSKFIPDYYVETIDSTEWLHFPWEK